MNDNQLTESLKAALRAAWACGQRELVLLTFKAATVQRDNTVARWIHEEFKYKYNMDELKDLTAFAAQLLAARIADAVEAQADAERTLDAETIAKNTIARAMAH